MLRIASGPWTRVPERIERCDLDYRSGFAGGNILHVDANPNIAALEETVKDHAKVLLQSHSGALNESDGDRCIVSSRSDTNVIPSHDRAGGGAYESPWAVELTEAEAIINHVALERVTGFTREPSATHR